MPTVADKQPVIWVVLPVFNEEPRLAPLFARWVQTESALGYPVRFVLVDDSSTDGSAEALRAFAESHSGVDVLTHLVNKGLGSTLRDGLTFAATNGTERDIVVTMDADNTHPPESVPAMLARLENPYCDVVIASRFQPGAKVDGLSLFRRLLSKGAALIFRGLSPAPDVRDYTCGFRVIRLNMLKTVLARSGDRLFDGPGFECTAAILLGLIDEGASCAEVPFHLEYAGKANCSHHKVGRTILGTMAMLSSRRFARWRGKSGQGRTKQR